MYSVHQPGKRNNGVYVHLTNSAVQVKRGPFHEHSPMLYDISGLLRWNKVNTGMAKMYEAEVLKKVPVIQHFPFGNLFPFVPSTH
jgi:serine/threonine-protein phosphatase 2A activator